MALRDRAALEPRLPAGLLDGLDANIATLSGQAAEAPRARAESKVATVSQNVAIKRAATLAADIRGAIKAAHSSAEVRRAYGVGAATISTVKAARATGEQILTRAASKPEEVREAGVLDADLAGLRAAVDAVVGADTAQENRRAAAPATTRGRNESARRLEDAVRRIAAAGQLQFSGDATRRAEYAGLVAKTAARAKAKPTPAA